MRCLGKERFRLFQGQRGISLIETVVALGILGLIGVAFLTALSTTSRSTDLYEQRVTASALAQSAVEEIKASDYRDSSLDPQVYDDVVAVVAQPPYNISTKAVQQVGELGTLKQEIIVSVSRGEHYILKLTTIKADW